MPRPTQGSTCRLLSAFSVLESCAAAAAIITMAVGGGAEPKAPAAQQLPAFTPTSTNWAPNFLFPRNLYQRQGTDAHIASEREMCEWFNAQFDPLMN